MYFCKIGKKNISTTSLKNLCIGFRATLNLCKNDIPLRPMYFKFGTLIYYVCQTKIYKTQKFSPNSFKVIEPQNVLKRVCLASFGVAMVTYFDVEATQIC